MSFIKKQSPNESAYWHFRINDLSNEQLEFLKNVECDWMVIGNIEKENEKGTHYHVAVKFNRSYKKSTARNTLLYNHELKLDKDYYLETKYIKSSIQQFVDYVIKNGYQYQKNYFSEDEDDDELPKEDKPKLSPLELNRLRLKMARENNTDWFLENDFNFMLSPKFAKLKILAQEDAIEDLTELNNYWIWGRSGTGKSSSVHYLYPNRYMKIVSNEKWDSYNNHNPGHEVVHIEELDSFEDIDKGMEGLAGLKNKADRYPFPVRMNYGDRNLKIRPKMFIITSNFTPNQILSGGDRYGRPIKGLETQLEALQRKFKIIHVSQWLELNKLELKKDENGKPIGIQSFNIEKENEEIEKKIKLLKRKIEEEEFKFDEEDEEKDEYEIFEKNEEYEKEKDEYIENMFNNIYKNVIQ